MTKKIERNAPEFPECYGHYVKDDAACRLCPCAFDCCWCKYGHSEEDDK